MAHKENSNTHGKENLKIISPESGRIQDPPNDGPVQEEDEDRADESPLFGIGGENKIRLRLGQEFQARLGAETQALADDLSGTDRHGGLESVIAGPMDIRQRIDEVINAGFLVRGKNKKPEDEKHKKAGQEDEKQVGLGNSGHQHHAEPDEEYDHRRTEVRLQEYQDERDKSVETGDKNMLDVLDLHVAAGKIFGEDQHQGELHHIHGLKRKEPKIQPALGAVGHVAKGKEREQDERVYDKDGN